MDHRAWIPVIYSWSLLLGCHCWGRDLILRLRVSCTLRGACCMHRKCSGNVKWMNELMSFPEDSLLVSLFQPLHCHPTSLVPWTPLPVPDGNIEAQRFTVWDVGNEGSLHQAKKSSYLPQAAYRCLGLLTIPPPPLLLWPQLFSILCQHLLHTSFRDSLSWCLLMGATCISECREETAGTLLEHLVCASCFTRRCYVISATILPDWDHQSRTPAPIPQMAKRTLREESSAQGRTFITSGPGPGPRFSKPPSLFSRTLQI